MPNTFKAGPAFVAVIASGFLLIPIGFLLLTNPEYRTSGTWLNMFTVCAVYLVNAANFFGIKTGITGFNALIPRLGIQWLAVVIYTVLAVAGTLIPWQNTTAGFNGQLFYQLVCFFIVVLLYVTGKSTSAHAGQVEQEEKETRYLIETLKQASGALCRAIEQNQAGWGEGLSLAGKIKDDLNYVSPSSLPEAISTEKQLFAGIENALQLSSSASPDRGKLKQQLQNCLDTIKQRKQIF